MVPPQTSNNKETTEATLQRQHYVIGVGSNLGDRAALLKAAAEMLPRFGIEILTQSSLLETAPEGGIADRPFLNAAWLCASNDLPQGLLTKLHAIEAQCGRSRDIAWGNRTLDLDILLWKQEGDPIDAVCRRFVDDQLAVPHPRLLSRTFALRPAAEVAPDWIHPDSQRRLRDEPLAQAAIVSIEWDRVD